ncbi:zinc finger protein 391 isoform X6 [Parasteatoda tepidariorum]|uniref:zinc finger protein 391 isoform X6 n=1 Tax=Parasteatoda tepidariorum TaxID=114398 RepID=UPI0039BC3516
MDLIKHWKFSIKEREMDGPERHSLPSLQKTTHRFLDPVELERSLIDPYDSRNIEENLQGNVDSSQIPNLFGNHSNANNANPANANNNNTNSRVNNHSGQMPPLQVPKKSMLPQMGPPQDSVAMGPMPTKMSPQHQNPNDLNPSANGNTGRKYQCKMCPQIFMHKSAMQHHSREAHRGDIKPYQCQQCLKSFSSNHQLLQHIRIHTGEKPYKCSYCDRRFKQLSHVQQHTRLHTGERPYKCHLPECNRAFIQLSNLQQHLRNHESQVERAKNRPYVCNTCGKCFATDSSLRTHGSKVMSCSQNNQHVALISNPFAQVCPMCHKSFVNSDLLMEHMQIMHKSGNNLGMSTTSKRRTSSHQCPLCGKTYVNEGSLRKHIASHQDPAATMAAGLQGPPLRMWPCTVCNTVFTQEAGLLHHMEAMRTDPRHQFAAQYLLSRAAAERRMKDPSDPSGSGMPPSSSAEQQHHAHLQQQCSNMMGGMPPPQQQPQQQQQPQPQQQQQQRLGSNNSNSSNCCSSDSETDLNNSPPTAKSDNSLQPQQQQHYTNMLH